jgi:hypothetical protein
MIWEPSRESIERTNVWRFMQRLGFSNREAFLHFSRANPQRFWDETMREMGVGELPKSLSGKIVRRLMRLRIPGQPPGDCTPARAHRAMSPGWRIPSRSICEFRHRITERRP